MLSGRLNRIGAFIRHYFLGLYRRFDEHHIFLLGGGLAFSLVVCTIPLTLIIFSGLGRILEEPSLAGEIGIAIDRAVPYTLYAAELKRLVFDRIEDFRAYKNVAGVVGILGLLFAASGLFSSMRTILSRAYGIAGGEPVLLGKLRDLGLVLLVLVYFLLSTMILPGVEIFKEMAGKLTFLSQYRLGFVPAILIEAASFIIIFGSFVIIYLAVPHQRQPIRVVFISAIWAALLWETAKRLFGFYIVHVAVFSRIYGAYTVAIVLIFWIYYTSLTFILGAEIGQLYREWKEGRLQT